MTTLKERSRQLVEINRTDNGMRSILDELGFFSFQCEYLPAVTVKKDGTCRKFDRCQYAGKGGCAAWNMEQ